MSLLHRYLTSLVRLARPDTGEVFVVAFSGGPDSTALLDLTIRAVSREIRVVAVHLDHALRPDSRLEAERVRSASIALGATSRVRRIDVPLAASRLHLSIEAAARRCRYDYLEETARREGARFVLTGHHADDQAETVLMRLLRGAGPSGLGGIAETRPLRPGSPVRLLRPMSGFSRSEILGYLDRRGLGFLTDPTNTDGSNLRGRLRELLLPWYRSQVPDLPRRLREVADLSDRLRAEWSTLARRHTLLVPPSPGFRFPPGLPAGLLRERLSQILPPGAPVIDRRALSRIRAACRRGRGTVQVGRGWCIRIAEGGGRLLVQPPTPGLTRSNHESLDVPLPVPGEVLLPSGLRIRAAVAGEAEPFTGEPHRELIDPGNSPLRVRYARPGDRFRPLGLGESTTVYRFLMARGVPRERRGRTPVVIGERGLLWVVGHRISEAAKVSERTAARVLLTSNRR